MAEGQRPVRFWRLLPFVFHYEFNYVPGNRSAIFETLTFIIYNVQPA